MSVASPIVAESALGFSFGVRGSRRKENKVRERHVYAKSNLE